MSDNNEKQTKPEEQDLEQQQEILFRELSREKVEAEQALEEKERAAEEES